MNRILVFVYYFIWRLWYRSQIKAGWVKVRKTRFYYQQVGVGYPLVFLHGGGTLLESFAGQIPFFAKKNRVIAIDSRGHGRSCRGKKPLTYETMANDTIEVLNELGVERADFVGWSDGGNTSLLLALSHPERVRNITLISANYHPTGIRGNFSISGNPFLKGLYQWVSPHPEKWLSLGSELEELWRLYPQISEHELNRIGAKTLIIAGENDMVTIGHLQEMEKLIPGAKLYVVAGGKHDVHLTHSLQVNRLIEKLSTH